MSVASEDSFLWTSASDNSSSSGDDADMAKSSKIKLEDREERTSNNDSQEINNSKINKSTSKKIKNEMDSAVKREVSEENICVNNYDDSYLNLRVKEEQECYISDIDNVPTKKKKKKKRKHSETENETLNDLTSEQSCVIDSDTLKSIHIETDEHINEQDTSSANAHIKHKKKKKRKNSSTENITHSSQYTLNSDDAVQVNGGRHTDTDHNSADDSYRDKNTTKYSDTLKFDDDLSDYNYKEDSKVTQSEHTKSLNSKLIKQFLKIHKNLNPVSEHGKSEAIITDNDDIWLVKCPKDMDIMSLKGSCLNSHKKTKLKINGTVYESIIENDTTFKLPLLSYNTHNHFVIKNSMFKGCFLVRNKLPKVHIVDSEANNDDKSSSIPLPETKLRHPLFGVHYKKRIKIDQTVAEKLQLAHENDVTDCEDRKNKKHKKKKRKIEVELNIEEDVKEESSPSKKKKKKKRKHSQGDDAAGGKRAKLNTQCEQAWESEQAIEETLFNF